MCMESTYPSAWTKYSQKGGCPEENRLPSPDSRVHAHTVWVEKNVLGDRTAGGAC